MPTHRMALRLLMRTIIPLYSTSPTSRMGGPVQRRAELAQRAAGEQRTHHQQQPRRRQVGQRRQKRLRKTLQLLQEFLHSFVPLSGTAHRRIHFIL